MKTLLISVVTSIGFMLASAAPAATAPASAPAGTTGMCKDGSFYSGATKKGACRGHQGVKAWYGAAAASSTSGSSANDATTASKTKSNATESKTMTSASTASTGTPPADATGLCNDGTYYSGATKKGACRGHKGVKTWYGGNGSAASSTPAAAPAAAPAPAAMPASPAMSTKAPAATAPATTSTSHASTGGTMASPAAGGGAGKVWVNTSSKVYHCEGDRYYGTTKQGEYMSEADAVAKGNRPAHGKACSS